MTNRDVINALAFGGSGGGGGGTEVVVSDPVTWTDGELVPESVIDFLLTHPISDGYAIMTKDNDDNPWALSSATIVTSGGTSSYRITFRNANFASTTESRTSQMTVAIETRRISASGNLENQTCRCYAAKLI